jgi:hypothetical protein
LKQKIELLNIQLKDSQDRELTTKKLHDTMLNAFKNNSQQEENMGESKMKMLVEEYEQKIADLVDTNLLLKKNLADFSQNFQLNNTPIKSVQDEENSKILQKQIEELKLENQRLRSQTFRNSESEEDLRTVKYNTDRQDKLDELEQHYEKSIAEITELHNREKTMLLERLETKKTFSFGDRSRRNNNVELESSYSLKDEIDKLHFMIEEKDYMNCELKQEILSLRQQITKLKNNSQQDEDFIMDSRELALLRKENMLFQEDLNKTEENYNEQ